MKKFKVPKFLKSVRYCLAAVNCLYLITGLILLISGIVALVIYKEYDLFITKTFYNVPAFAIATGVIILLSSGLGFYAAISQQFHFVAAYAILTIVVLVFELAVVIAGFGLRNNVTSEIRSAMAGTIQLYEERREVAVMWDNLQIGFECCGVTGRHDWNANRIPVSCCHIDFGTVSPFQCTLVNAFTTSCVSALGDWLEYNAHAMAATAAFVICLQVLNTAAAGWLAYRTKFEEVELESY